MSNFLVTALNKKLAASASFSSAAVGNVLAVCRSVVSTVTGATDPAIHMYLDFNRRDDGMLQSAEGSGPWTWGAGQPGPVVLRNDDWDLGADGPDCEAADLEGSEDAGDRSVVMFRREPADALPPGWQFAIGIDNVHALRIFNGDGPWRAAAGQRRGDRRLPLLAAVSTADLDV